MLRSFDVVLLGLSLLALYVTTAHENGYGGVRYQRAWYFQKPRMHRHHFSAADSTRRSSPEQEEERVVQVPNTTMAIMVFGNHVKLVSIAETLGSMMSKTKMDGDKFASAVMKKEFVSVMSDGRSDSVVGVAASADGRVIAMVTRRGMLRVVEVNGEDGEEEMMTMKLRWEVKLAGASEKMEDEVFGGIEAENIDDEGDDDVRWYHELAIHVTSATDVGGKGRSESGAVIVAASLDKMRKYTTTGDATITDEERGIGFWGDALADALQNDVDDAMHADAMQHDVNAKLEDVSHGWDAAQKHHITYQAFSLRDGTQLWRMDSADYDRGLQQHRRELIPQQGVGPRRFEELSCREYRDAVLAQMPHRWRTRSDTALSMAKVHRHRHVHDRSAERELLRKQMRQLGRDKAVLGAGIGNVLHASGILSEETSSSSLSGRPARTRGAGSASMASMPEDNAGAFENEEMSNAIVAHLEEGIEIISVRDGKPLCKLLLGRNAAHADVNGDGVMDHVSAYGSAIGASERTDGPGNAPDCLGVVRSGVLGEERLFEGALCRRKINLRHSGGPGPHAQIDVVTPTLLPRGVDTEGRAAVAARQRPTYDSVFLTSRGEVTSYSPKGERRWTLLAGTYWTPDDEATSGPGDSLRSFPSITPMRLYSEWRFNPASSAVSSTRSVASSSNRGTDSSSQRQIAPSTASIMTAPTVLVVVGDQRIAVIDAEGDSLWSDQLPPGSVVTAPVQLLDFDGDGVMDIVLRTRDGVIAYRGVLSAGAIVYQVFLGILIVCMLGVYAAQNPLPSFLFATSSSARSAGGRKRL